MKLKNYTTTVSPEKTIGEIEALLQEAGATAIMKDFSGGKITAVAFKLVVEWGDMFIRLPANVEQVHKVLSHGKYLYGRKAEILAEQAERTAWRLMKDWVAVQMSLIAMKQAQAAQVFLPYAIVGQDEQKKPMTMFQAYRDTQMKMLSGHNGEKPETPE